MQKLEGSDKKKSKMSKQSLGDSKGGTEADSAMKGKGEAPDRFWSSVEPYCADITDADIKFLEDAIASYDNTEELFEVPKLGKHYSRRWALDDLSEEQKESQRLGSMADPLAMWDKVPEKNEKEGFDSLLKTAESSQQQQIEPQYGPLTERLIGAFIEDPITGSHNVGSSKSRGAKLNLPTDAAEMESFEMRLKKELLDLGLLDPDSDEEEEEDEILAELQRKQAELATLMEYNRKQHEVLLGLAKKEMEKQKIQEAIDEVDEELNEWLKKSNSMKQKKKQMGRKEKESIWKAIETRDNLLKKLDRHSQT